MRFKLTVEFLKLKWTDDFVLLQNKEPEYTKVRRKGGRLRDPHSESQGMNRECLRNRLINIINAQNPKNRNLIAIS